MTIGDEARKALEAGPLIHFTTLNADGSPHTVVVWAGVDSDGEHVVIGKMNEDKKVRNLRRDPRVSLSLEAEGTTHGLANYLVIEGTAELVEGGGRQLLQRLAKVYMGPDADFLLGEQPDGFVITVTPTKIRGNGPW